MIGRFPVLIKFPIVSAFGSNIEFLADDRLYSGCTSALVEIDDAEHCPMVGNSKGRELEIGSVPGQI